MTNRPVTHKYMMLMEQIKSDIINSKYPPGSQLETEDKLSERYNVSRQTVRRAIGILEQDGLIIRKQGSGTYVSKRATSQPPTKNIGVVVTYMSDYILPSIIRGIEDGLSAAGYSFSLFSTGNRMDTEKLILSSFLERPVDGILIEGAKTALPNPNLEYYRQFQSMGIPLVFMSGYYSALGDSVYVVTDDRGGGKQATELLVAKGHRKIGGIFKADDMQGHERFAGFIEAARANDVELHDSAIHWFTTETRDSLFEPGNIERIIDSFKDCTAVICYNDQIAAPLLNALQRSGRTVPGDIAVISFDNSSFSDITSVKITSLNHPKEDVGRLAAQKLLNMIDGKTETPAVLPWGIIEKEST